MSNYTEGISPFEGAELTEAYLIDAVSSKYGELFFSNVKRWGVAQEDVDKELWDGKFELFNRLPTHKSVIGNGSANLYFYSEKEGKLANLVYTWPEKVSENVAIQSQFDEWYRKMQEETKVFVPGQHTISPFATKEFYEQFAEE